MLEPQNDKPSNRSKNKCNIPYPPRPTKEDKTSPTVDNKSVKDGYYKIDKQTRFEANTYKHQTSHHKAIQTKPRDNKTNSKPDPFHQSQYKANRNEKQSNKQKSENSRDGLA